jgi:nucleotide-binding universal stress UspA family protein
MSYPTVVLHLDGHAGLEARIDQGARLARRFESHLVGLSAADHGLFGLSVATGFSGTPRLAQALEETRAATRERAERFQQRMEMSIAHVSFEAVVDDDDELLALVRRSTCCDLLVLAQPDPSWPGHARSREQLEQVVLQSAAPTLVLPSTCQHPLAANKVMIAWDGSHGAARAVSGALPLLQRANSVHLVRCKTREDVDRDVQGSGFDLPREWLGRHGVRIDALLDGSGDDVCTTLLARAAALGADLVVMGAWGTPRWAERLVGGTTRSMLARMGVTLLMSH